MKKRIILLLLILSIVMSLTACGSASVKKTAVVEGSIFGGQSDDKIRVEVSFDPNWITKGKNTVYNPELAQFCALLSSDSYFRQKDLDKARQNRVVFDEDGDTEYSMTGFLSTFGFTETEHYESYLALEDPTDSNDSVTLNIGHQTIDGKYDVYVVGIRGCFSWQEWCSAFDPGSADEAYEKLTGVHPDWTHEAYHKGTDVAAGRALAFIENFIVEHNDEKLPDCILLTGHSRGGAIANLLGAYFEKEPDIRSYTYTFNTMPVACVDDADSCQTIFNIFDENDFFTDPFPFENSNFRRFGIDKTLSGTESDAFRSAVAVLKGRDDYISVPAEAFAEYRRLFAERFPDRETLCDDVTVSFIYDSKELAAAGIEEITALISAESGLGLEDLCIISDVTDADGGKYSLTVTYRGLTLLRSYAKILAYGAAAYDAFIELFSGDEIACRIASLLVENADGINGGHLLANSYVIAGFVSK